MRGMIGFLFALVLVYMGVITPQDIQEAGDKLQEIAEKNLSH
mgnify:CR=1 FL=1|jgi:hypothetical protein